MARQVSRAAARVAGARRPARDVQRLRREAALGAPSELDRLIHERIRLGIVSALAVNESLSFNELKKLLKTTDGNLSDSFTARALTMPSRMRSWIRRSSSDGAPTGAPLRNR